MQYRHEWKIEISPQDRLILRSRLAAVTERDPHAPEGAYRIRSLYFDTPEDRALREKQDGVSQREKFRLRLYNADSSFIRLEKKCKTASLGAKLSAKLTAEETAALLRGDTLFLRDSAQSLCRELYIKMTAEGLRPKTLVDYTREAFVYLPGNVRVTLDYAIRTGLTGTDFLDPETVTVPVPGDPSLLEVKWDAYLPEVIRAAVQLDGRRAAAFSKYEKCRAYDGCCD